MIVKLHKIMGMETENNNYIYYYMITNKQNLYLKTRKRMILDFYNYLRI